MLIYIVISSIYFQTFRLKVYRFLSKNSCTFFCFITSIKKEPTTINGIITIIGRYLLSASLVTECKAPFFSLFSLSSLLMLASLTFFIDLITFRYWCLIGFNLNCCFTSWIR